QAVHTVVYNRAGDNAIVLDGAVMVNDGNSHYSPYAAEIGKRGTAVTFKGRIYYFRIVDHQTGQTVVDLVPVRRVSDNAVGFYDLAKGAFVPPVGEGVKPGLDDFSIPDQTFTGEVVCPQVSVLLAGSDTPRPVPDEEFSVCYSNNVSMGVASVTVTGKGRAETHAFRITGPASVGLALEGDFAIKTRRQATRFDGVPDIKVVDREGLELDPSLYTIGYAGVDRPGTATAYAKINGGQHTGVLVARTFPVVILPSKYSLLEWVGLDGTQYFDTGVVPLADPGYEISFDYYTTEFVGGDGGFVFATAATPEPWKHAHWTEYNGNYTYGWNGDGFTTLNITCEQKRHSVVYNRLGDRAIVLDGEVKDSTNRKYGSTSTVQIGRREKSATYKGRIYSFMIRQHSADNSYASILVPAMRKSDQAVGFYDAVADEFIVPEDGRTAIPGPVRPLCGLFLVVQ
ncbi:MAG: hypothetical protein KBT68_01865, partial [bacterium]|nr:hypothetical protein [Candidatus Colisoma equi]